MNTKPLLEKLINNWPVKAICFILAAMIYFFHQISLLETKTLSVPLEVRKEGNMIPVDGLQMERYVKIKVRAKREQISSVTDKDITAYVDISSRTKEGTWNFPISVNLSDRLIRLDLDPLEITAIPDNLRFEIQKKESKIVPVKTAVFGSPAHGYRALDVRAEPSHVYLSGPKFMLDEIDEIPIGVVNIEGAEFTVAKIVKVINPNAYVSVLDENHVKLSVPIVSEATVKELNGVEIKYNSLPEQFELVGEKQKINILIEGSVLNIEKFMRKNMSVYVDLSSISEEGTHVLPVLVELSPAYSLVQRSLSEVSVTVVKKKDKVTENEDRESQ